MQLAEKLHVEQTRELQKINGGQKLAKDLKYGSVTVENEPGNPFGEDEPVFIIRARDESALEAINYYFKNAENFGASEEFVNAGDEVIQAFLDWRTENAELVKIPD